MATSNRTSSTPSLGSASQPRIVQVAEIVDRTRFAGLPALASIFTVLALVFDGFDIQAVGFVAPALLDDWHVSRVHLGPVMAAALVGMVLGAILMGPLGDKRGRRPALIASMLTVAAGTLLSAFADTPCQLALFRFVTGLGLGGSLPNATALLIELAPLAIRHLSICVTIVGVPIGGVIGAEVAAQLLPHFGWRSVFLVGAVLPAALALMMWLRMPESPSFLARQPERTVELAHMMNRLAGAPVHRSCDSFLVAEPENLAGNTRWRALLGRAYRTDTLLLWAAFFASMFSAYALFSWLPTVLAGVGLPVGVALRCALVFNMGGVLGALVIASAMNRFGSRPILLTLALLGLIITATLAGFPDYLYRATNIGPLLLLMAAAGSALLGMQVGLYSVAAHAYPSWMRSSGVGAAVGVGRVGGILSALAGGLGGVIGGGVTSFFGGIFAALIFLAVVLACFRRHVAPLRADRRQLVVTRTDGSADQAN